MPKLLANRWNTVKLELDHSAVRNRIVELWLYVKMRPNAAGWDNRTLVSYIVDELNAICKRIQNIIRRSFAYMKRLSIVIVMALVTNLLLFNSSGQASSEDSAEKTALAAADFNYLLGNFEQPDDSWRYSFGDQPTVAGSFTVIESTYSYEGRFAGQLQADFTKSDHSKPEFVAIKKEVDEQDIEQFAFWVKTSDMKALRFRTVDKSGQIFQQRVELQDTTEWQQVVVSQMGAAAIEHWGGANDGVWHKPAKAVSILIDRNDIKNGALTASILVDQVTAQVIAPPADFDYLISDFEQESDNWLFSFGDTPAVKGSFNVIESAESYTGNYMGQLKADFSQRPTGSPYVSIKKEVDELDIEQLAFWVKTSDLKSLRIRTTDSTGQTFQQRIELQNISDWQQVVVSQMGSESFTYWNGANDGVWHKPAGAITILFDRFDIKNSALTATVLVDQMTAQIGDWVPELKIQQTALGNIFLEHEPNAFVVRTGRPTVNWAAYDIYGAQVASGSESTSAGKARISVPFSKLGYFTLEVSAEQPGSEPLVRKTAYAVISSALPPGNGESPFGVSTHLNWTASGWSKELSKLIRYMGASFVRDGMEWGSIEKQKGVYTFAPSPDDYMQKLAENDIKLLFVAAFNNPFYDNNATPYTDAGRKGLAEYAKAYVEQYKDQLIGFNVYNEFNGGFGKRGNSPANSQPDYYFKLMKETYNVVKPAHPDVPVVGIVSGGVDLNWIEGVLKGVGEGEDKNAGLKYLDAVSVQTYMDPNAPDEVFAKLEGLKTLIKQYNDGKLVPIWVTEFGSPTHQSAKGVDEKTQANYLPRGFVSGLGFGVERMSWYDFMNDGLKADYNEDNFGLVRHKDDPMGAYTPKPAYASYAAMSRQLAGAAFEEIEQFGDPIKSNLFTKGGEALRVVWAQNETQAVIETDKNLEITDFMGNTEIYTPHNGKIYMTITGEPFYIKGSISRIVKDDTFAITGEQTAVGDPHTFTVTVKNEAVPQLALTAKMEENSYPIVAEQGQPEALSLTVSETREGFRAVTVHLLDEAGNKIGKLQHEVATGVPHKVTVRPAMQQIEGQYSQTLNIDVENFRKAVGLTVSSITWQVGGQSGQELVNTAVLPGSKQQFSIPLSPIAPGGDQPASIRVEFAEQEPYVYQGNFSFNPVNRGTIAVNDRIEPEIEALAPTIDLSQGKPVLLSGHSGTIEVSGQAWLHFDQDHLYLTAKIKDNVHAAAASGADIWNNDSIQFALSLGIPGESRGWYEYGISDSPNGPQIYRWTAMGGLPVGPVHNGEAAVTRDEEQKLTIYKLALPWSELTPIQPQRGDVMSFSLLVNENDGKGRRGWMEWGSGIGNEKRPSLFRSMQWMYNQAAPAVYDAAYTVKAGQEVQGILKADHAEGAELTFEIVENGKQGTAAIVDSRTGEFVYTPLATASREDFFTFRVFDRYEYSNTAKVTITIDRPDALGDDASLKSLHLNGEPVAGAGIVTGFADHTYRPDQAVTRQELIVILARALKPQAGAGQAPSFTDEAKIGKWAADAVKSAVQAGWITGYSDGSFRPQEGITRVELAAVLARTTQDDVVGGGQLSKFRDAEQIPVWAQSYVAQAAASGLMEGMGAGLFKPAGSVTRAEAAAVAVRLIEQSAK
ncbi:Endo-1,4-beta-xylanase, GH35 family [Paenibacillus uliginis N3/975]|uniref:Endo-1,4-beta-xylanase, GH35 family n=1 Tax=Paenibacillus uliginis N3/975 TaxID=1313296 RepID=A0A1X7GQV5_9BACL|nr:S-layer homology domain-containing protein [Paenibacillus uliginis]SMF73229.1 Endo-1,4-beta-xylanase, GH35 family [Paenibacillus uliginis N3/975]